MLHKLYLIRYFRMVNAKLITVLQIRMSFTKGNPELR